MLLGGQHPKSECLSSLSESGPDFWLNSLPVESEKSQVRVHINGFLPVIWEICIEFLAPGFGAGPALVFVGM